VRNAYTPVPVCADQVRWLTERQPQLDPADARKALRWAGALATRWSALFPRGVDLDEIHVEAACQTLRAVERWDPRGGASFATFASKAVRFWLQNRYRRALYYETGEPLPETVSLDALSPEWDTPDPRNACQEVESTLWVNQQLGRFSLRQQQILKARMERGAAPTSRKAQAADPATRQVVHLKAQGLSNREIGRRLGRDQHWVKRRLSADAEN
jgi:RNA polymerase sigma factor (sigma-70 family)